MDGQKPEKVKYSTFVNDLTEARVGEVNIYRYGREIDLTYTLQDGGLRATKGPLGLDNDTLLSQTLKTQEVSFTVHAESYPEQGNEFWWMQIMSLSFFIVPILMLMVILRQSKAIRTLSMTIAALARPEQGGES